MITIELIHPFEQKAVQSWKFDLAQKSISIGRSRKNDIPLASAVVSRNHAVLHREARGWRLEPLGTNGCFIEEKPAAQVYLRNGQVFRIAKTGPRLRIVQGADPDEASLLLQQRRSRQLASAKENTLSSRDTFVGGND